ncbi:Membrane-bound lytic murein transglycosylase B precursor [Tritonibacter multivorans]|uniref:Membrane-bound lytic murein transglycosylase B n=1 Tax=Tritonibacter multivorans TaxID=928856 RepID=A0A0P1GE53_9RHOB|nr:lytic murein transglycosylase [Tritonibacter multivorans]MDA7420179.1 lytic murein transglycosylase [Tritonibacter multivorans]CUH79840.1 Membrane-bound lytic murein transglycosylase B precursor [Tritonibacter multivorans]SFC01304.1 lytic murein transglycosylase [Tritonibacter multivorans]
MTTWLKLAVAATAIMATPTWAEAPQTSPRPTIRPALLDHAATATPRPRMRALVNATASSEIKVADNARFDRWLKGFFGRARAQGISQATLNRAFQGVSYDADVIKRDRNQSEFTKTIWQYLDSAASDTRVKNGGKALRQHRKTLERIEAHYGVEKEVVVAVWGLESSFGSYRGDMDVIQSLATLAFDGRRGKFFEAQLIAALKILQSGDVAPRKMKGSWAGAMGHTQFIPTSYLAYAVDFTGDGKRDIWSENPTDALASTAAYLKRSGWTKGQPWGVEVRLPKGFNYALASRKVQKSPAEWARLGVRNMEGGKVPNHGTASILLPGGGNGAAFMIFKNFAAIERYNAADAYVIGVGHLSDRLAGGPEIKGRWPRGDRALKFRERKEMQRRLTRAGFDTDGVDGKIGPKTITAIRNYQIAKGLTPDGYASLSLLQHLR